MNESIFPQLSHGKGRKIFHVTSSCFEVKNYGVQIGPFFLCAFSPSGFDLVCGRDSFFSTYLHSTRQYIDHVEDKKRLINLR